VCCKEKIEKVAKVKSPYFYLYQKSALFTSRPISTYNYIEGGVSNERHIKRMLCGNWVGNPSYAGAKRAFGSSHTNEIDQNSILLAPWLHLWHKLFLFSGE